MLRTRPTITSTATTPAVTRNTREIVAPERRAMGFTTRPLVSADPALPPIVGFARTATIRAVVPSTLPPGEQGKQRADYYTYVIVCSSLAAGA